jgi:HTH-type transcriptional regulator/antitoxin HipB
MMLPFELQSQKEMALTVAGRVKALRLERGWTQEEAAERAGLALATYRVFERTGRISLDRLLRLATILDARAGFEKLFEFGQVRSLAELEQRAHEPQRRRGRPRHAQS